MHDLGLVAIWDDGDDLHAEPRAPYPHTREVLLLRAEREGTAALVGGFARTVEAEYLLRTGWAREIAAPRDALRERVHRDRRGRHRPRPRARPARPRPPGCPSQVHDAIRAGLAAGPVLVQTPRSGYAASLACERCRTPARCAACAGPLALTGPTTPPACRWCGTVDDAWACRECGHRGLRAPVLGDGRTAEELGRAFPRTLVRTSGGDRVARRRRRTPAIVVVATPGAEPVADGRVRRGGPARHLADARPAPTCAPTRRRCGAGCNAAGWCAPAAGSSSVGDAGHPALQALVRWDLAGFAARETEERARGAPAAGQPPGDHHRRARRRRRRADAAGAAAGRRGPRPGARPATGSSRVVVRVPRGHGPALSSALGDLQRLRSSRKLDAVRIQVDPLTIG